MGSLSSRPKTPAVVSQPVIYTAPVATPPANTTNSTSDAADTPTKEEQQEAARSAGLLDRRRGLLSTVVTGFRGILTQGATPPRKTLLGE